jgi:hypothetical protein
VNEVQRIVTDADQGVTTNTVVSIDTRLTGLSARR